MKRKAALLLLIVGLGAWVFHVARSDAGAGARGLPERSPEETLALVDDPEPEDAEPDLQRSAPARPEEADEDPEEEDPEDGDLREDRILTGLVRTEDGVGLPDAEVRFGSATTVTDLAGEFDLTIPYVTAETPVVAFKAGYQPAVRTAYGQRARQTTGDLGPIELVVRRDPADITGRLVDEDGNPCAEWEVDLYDVSAVAPASGDPRPAEDLAAGRSNRQRSGLDGSFAMGGLRTDRPYRLRAWNEETLQTFVSAPIEAPASGYRFTLPLRDVHARVDGVVLGTDGAPLEDVRVRLTMVVDEREINGVVQSNEMHTGQTVTTGEDGRFTFHDVPHARVFLRFHGQDVVARPYDVRPDSPVEDLAIVLPRQGRFELAREPGSTLAPDAFEVWDVAGGPIAVKQSGAYPPPGRYPLEGGEPATYRCGDDARWLVLFEGAREVERRELRIRPGETIVVSY